MALRDDLGYDREGKTAPVHGCLSQHYERISTGNGKSGDGWDRRAREEREMLSAKLRHDESVSIAALVAQSHRHIGLHLLVRLLGLIGYRRECVDSTMIPSGVADAAVEDSRKIPVKRPVAILSRQNG